MTPHLIASVDELREVIPANETSALKLGDVLDERARSYIAESPFLVLSTSDGHGRTDASPKGDAPGFVLVEIRSGLWKQETWPPKRKISFGAIVAPKLDPEVPESLVKAIDDLVDEDARVNL